MNLCLHRGGRRFSLGARQALRIVSAESVVWLPWDLDQASSAGPRPALIEGQPGLVHEPETFQALEGLPEAGPRSVPKLVVAIRTDGDLLLALAADRCDAEEDGLAPALLLEV